VLAVFERIDMDIVGRLLSAAAGEQSLSFVTFANQIVDKTHSAIPDAMISASFTYLFEVKTTRDMVDREQLKRHLAHLTGSTKSELLFVLTPDVTRPEPTMNLDKRIVWFNFHALNEGIKEVLTGPLVVVSEQSRFLLRELQSLFVLDGLLLDDEDTVLVAARVAYPMYLQYSAYVCQAGRGFRQGLRYIGFYTGNEIKLEVPCILSVRDNVEFTQDAAKVLVSSGAEIDKRLAELIDRIVTDDPGWIGAINQVFLLSSPTDHATIKLVQPIKNSKRDYAGKPFAYILGQTYTSSRAISTSPKTTDDLEYVHAHPKN